MLYLFDPITCQKSEITYEKLEGITGKNKGNLMSLKSKKRKVGNINCYLIDENTTNAELREMLESEVIKNEYWVDIPGTHNQISDYGRYRTITKKGPKMMLIYNATKNKACITLTINGKKEKLLAHTKVGEMFLEKPKGDVVLRHKDGNGFNCRANNLEYVDRKWLARRTGPLSNQIAVVKKDPVTGEILDEYRSMREAARKNFLCHEAVHQAIRENRLCAGYLYEIDREAI